MRSFEIVGNKFILDGKPIRIISGAIHYFRVHPDLWEDRIAKMSLMGLNCIEMYIAWNMHERQEGVFDFSGIADFERMIQLAQAYDLMVIVRPGPYICAEWEFGGLPAWLLKDADMILRSSDPKYLKKVDAYFDVVIPKIADLQIDRGGPVIAVQVENEYGSYSNDKEYLRYLAEGMERRGIVVPLFTSDGEFDFMLQYGTLPDILKTVNFGSNATAAFRQLRKHQSSGPLMCMEFWNGWFDHWFEKHHGGDYERCVENLKELLETGGHLNFYMCHGGTNFGFMNGANHNTDNYEPTVTSYDYDAAISECGDITPKFRAFRKTLEKVVDLPPFVEPREGKKISIPPFRLTESAGLFHSLESLSSPCRSPAPLSMEQLGQDYGFILYRTELPGPREDKLELRDVHDRAIVYINGQEIKTVYRNDPEKSFPVVIPEGGAVLEILVENMGRVNYGPHLFDRKGISRDVILGWQILSSWEIFPLPLDSLQGLAFSAGCCDGDGPRFYRGIFPVEEVGDSFLSLPRWNKCVCWINGFNLGRYWHVGPQKTLYVPAPVLRPGENEIIVFELHDQGDHVVEFLDKPILA